MFEKKTIWQEKSTKKAKWWFLKGFAIFLVCVVCVAGVGYAGKFIINQAQVTLWYISANTIDVVSDNFGKKMIQDGSGNINVLLIGMWWENHDGWTLADAIIIASWNPKLESISMISIPRDLYVDITFANTRGRINEVFSDAYYKNEKSLDVAAKMLATKVEEITSINAPYYAVVDFGWFKNIIDAIGGIDIYVPERIYDTTYPNNANRGYTTFHIERGEHHLDGETALKYARSRHSSSDFARSQRQQDIVEATIKQILRKENIQNVATIKKLYDEYTKMVTTNISNKEIIGMIKYIFSLEHIFNFGLTSTCSTRWRQLMYPWCFLYTPDRDWFWWASVLLTNGSTYGNFSFYDYTRNFWDIVSHHQKFLIENAAIKVLNGIDKSYAQQARKWTDGHATQIAVKLRRYGFNIIEAWNADSTQTGTTVLITWTWDYSETIAIMERFFPISEVIEWEFQTWTDLIVTLGNAYIDARPDKFNYNQ